MYVTFRMRITSHTKAVRHWWPFSAAFSLKITSQFNRGKIIHGQVVL